MTLRPALRPGAVLLRRDAHHLQIGTSPGYVLRDRPGLFSFIRMLDGVRTMGQLASLAANNLPELEADIGSVVAELMTAGLVFDAHQWEFPANPGLRAEARAACLSGRPTRPLAHRSQFRVSLEHDPGCAQLAGTVTDILSQAGIRSVPIDRPDFRVMLSNGEPNRRRFEAAMAADQDHLRVVIDEDRVRIGPLVRPGLTPCVNCHDLHRADWDRAWPALMTQFGSRAASGSAPALRATTRHAAATAIAAEVIGYCGEAGTDAVGQCLVVGPDFLDRKSWPISFHPACSCSVLMAA